VNGRYRIEWFRWIEAAVVVAAFFALLHLAGCAGTPPTPTGTIGASHQLITAFEEQAVVAAERGRISPEKATRLVNEGEKTRGMLIDLRAALTACGGKLPCQGYDNLLRLVQEQLFRLECELRQEQAGLPIEICRRPPAAPTTGAKP
jgi:hypothetical protein